MRGERRIVSSGKGRGDNTGGGGTEGGQMQVLREEGVGREGNIDISPRAVLCAAPIQSRLKLSLSKDRTQELLGYKPRDPSCPLPLAVMLELVC